MELADLVCRRARSKGVMGWVVSAGFQGADFDYPTGFYRQMKMPIATNITKHVYETAKQLFERYWDGSPVRKVAVTLSSLVSDREYQLTLFDDRERLGRLERTVDAIRDRFGDTAVMRAASVTEAGQAKRRSIMIGGHYK